MDDLSDRFPPIEKDQLPDEQRAAYERIEKRRGRVPAPYVALLGSPDVADAFEQLSSALQNGALPPIVLESVFLMTARRHRCRYLWMNHLGKAVKAGLDDEAIAALGRGEVPVGPEAVVEAARFHNALQVEHRVPQAMYERTAQVLGARGLVDLIAFSGFAASVAMLLNVRQPELPQGRPAPF